MRSRGRRAAITFLLLIPIAGGVRGYQRPRFGGSLRRVMFAPVIALDPVACSSAEEIEIARNVHATLLDHAPDGSYRPYLAEEYRVEGEPPSRLRIKLREGLAFHNGRPLTAVEAQGSLARLLQLRPELSRLPGVPAASGIRATSPLNLDIDIRGQGAACLLELLASPMASIALPPDDRGIPSGAGAFAIAEAVGGTRLRLQAFGGHARGRPFLDTVVVEAVLDPAEQRRLLQGEGWDVCDLPAASDPPRGAAVLPSLGEETALIYFPRARPPFSVPAYALALARVDRAGMVDVILKGRGSAAIHLLSDRLFPPLQGYLPARAADSKTPPSGPKPRAVLVYPSHDTDLALAAERIKFELRDALSVEPRPLALADFRAKLSAGDYDAALGTAFVDETGLVTSLARELGRDLPSVPAALSDPARVLTAIVSAEPGASRRVALFHRARRYLVRDGVIGAIMDPGGLPRYDDAWRQKP